jgi:4-hydroxy-3-methylbut-2-enyl diphosphate reductase
MKVLVASPRGFCAGVERAVSVVDLALQKYPQKKIFVLHEIVHNKKVIDDFSAKGVCFTEDLKEVPEGAVLIFSAHGIAKQIKEGADKRNLTLIDATCPLVTKVHKEVNLYQKQDRQIIVIGNKNHPEVIATVSRAKSNAYIVENLQDIENLKIDSKKKLSYVTQTTLSVDWTKKMATALKQKFPDIVGNFDICYATQNRQDAVKKLAQLVDVMLIIGSCNSSNSKNLSRVARSYCAKSYLIDSFLDVDLSWFNNANSIGISSGASAPEVLVRDLLDFLKKNFTKVEISDFLFKSENVKFKLPTI